MNDPPGKGTRHSQYRHGYFTDRAKALRTLARGGGLKGKQLAAWRKGVARLARKRPKRTPRTDKFRRLIERHNPTKGGRK